jgi:hypothetical protein
MSQPRRNPPRSAKRLEAIDFTDEEAWHPEMKPKSDIDHQIRKLNGEAYSADIFGRVDDLLVFALFATKQASNPKKRRHHAVLPVQVSNQKMLTNDDGAIASQVCKPLHTGNEASMVEVKRVVSELQERFPLFQSAEQEWEQCLQQCVKFLFVVWILGSWI